ncbi:MAG TPA: HD domain-containing phosphohydrolase [Gemmatimonadaceae bacterium]|nr:HD domain-containing phosphohydrolase [Gemmatimonadaceae bacterium]
MIRPAGGRSAIVLAPAGPSRERLADALEEWGWTVAAVASASLAVEQLESVEAPVLFCDTATPGLDVVALCRRVRGDPRTAHALVFVLSDHADAGLRTDVYKAGADDFMAKPVDLVELRARVDARLRRGFALEGGAGTGAPACEQVLPLLLYLLDLSVPGAARRGRELADMALRLADAFEVPKEFLPGLRLAAMLHEIGRVLHLDGEGTAERRWQYTLASKAILSQVAAFHEAADLVGCIYENWDGSGMPGHLQRGEIPLRARFLRILIDYAALRRGEIGGRPATFEEALEALRLRSGTWYDPVVVERFTELAGRDAGALLDGGRRHVGISELREGMVLAEDLRTGSGVKLLARGAVLSRGHLEIILQRHLVDPIIEGAWIEMQSVST